MKILKEIKDLKKKEKELMNESDEILKSEEFNEKYKKMTSKFSANIFNACLKKAEKKLISEIGYYDWRYWGIMEKWVLEYIPIVINEIKIEKEKERKEKIRIKNIEKRKEKKKKELKKKNSLNAHFNNFF